MYDRGNSATSKLQPGQVDWNNLFNKRGVRWFHTGGIMASLSASTRQVVADAVKAAHEAVQERTVREQAGEGPPARLWSPRT